MMTHHAQLNLIMFATIIGVVVFLYFRPESQDIQEYSISSSPAETVRSLRIVRQQKEIVLKQLDNRWYLIKPVQVRADEKKIIDVLEILTASSNQRFPLADLGRFSLDQPNVQLYIDDEYFGFGGFSPITNQQYVAAGDYVYLISPRYVLTLPLSASDLISPGLLATNEIPVKFELSHLTVEFQSGIWNIIVQDSEEALNEETIKHWVQLWQTANARELTLDHEFDTDFVERGLIKMSLQDGQEISLRILQNESEVIFLRVNEGIGYHFFVDVGRQLLDPYTIKSNQILFDN
jgi:hypothetical protein